MKQTWSYMCSIIKIHDRQMGKIQFKKTFQALLPVESEMVIG